LYDSSISKQQTSADVNQSEKSLKIQLVRANLEIERLTLRIRVLDQDIITAKKFADFTEQKLNHQKLEEFIKKVKQIDLFHKKEMIQIKEQIESKDNLIQLLKYEIDSLKNEGLKRNESYKKKVLELEDLIEQNKKHQYPSDFFLNETNTEYENFKKQIFDFNLNNVDKTSIIQKLEALCEVFNLRIINVLFESMFLKILIFKVSYSSNKKVEKQAEELKAKESIVERQKKELAKSQADSSEADIKIEMLQKECKEKEDYIGQMDDYWNKMASKLKAFQSLQSDKQIIVFKDLFREISQCMLAVNDISVYVIKKEGKINPVDSIFIKKKDIFSSKYF